MNNQDILALLTEVKNGAVSPELALEKLQMLPYSNPMWMEMAAKN